MDIRIVENHLTNYVNGEWLSPDGGDWLPVHDPATNQVLTHVPLTPVDSVDQAVQVAVSAALGWRKIPATVRIQYLFTLKTLLEENIEEISQTITLENGKTLAESHGEMRRAIENVEVACGIPTMMMGDFSEDVARGVDEYMIRQPVGVAAIICPFNFPGMIPFWYLPYALACGNSVIVKPSERCPITMWKIFHLFEKAGFPDGVVNLVNGGPETVNALLDHPGVDAVTFVGSTPTARHVYSRASASGKRVQAQGGAKNPIIILPDADPELTTSIVSDSAFGNAGQRCLAASLVVTVAAASQSFIPSIVSAAQSRVVGHGLQPETQMGPVITAKSCRRIEGLIDLAVGEGAELLVDGRTPQVSGCEDGYFLRPTVLTHVGPTSTIATTEVFGPVLGVLDVETIDDAINLVNSGQYGNMACLFTSSGAAARRFRYEVHAGNIGINIGVAAPMAFFPFSGWKNSFFGTLHAQGKHAVEFFTQTKVVIERWHEEWSRKF